MDTAGSRIEGNRLIVGADISANRQGIERLFAELLEGGSGEIVLDMSAHTGLRSADLAVIAAYCALAGRRGRSVKVVAGATVAKALRFGGVDRVARIEPIAGG